jgi:non-heme chloroperoxidase
LGNAQPVVFSHGWPLSADDWEGQMPFLDSMAIASLLMTGAGTGALARRGMAMRWTPIRTIWRRCSKRSSFKRHHRWAFHRRGEVARYLGRHGARRIAKAVLISVVPPLVLKKDKNPGGLPISVFDGLRAELAANRAQFYKDITLPFYGFSRPGAKILRRHPRALVGARHDGRRQGSL